MSPLEEHVSIFKMLIDSFSKKSKKKIVSEEEVKQLLEEGERSGVIDKTEHELIHI